MYISVINCFYFAADHHDTPSYKKYLQLLIPGTMPFGSSADGLNLYELSSKSIWPEFLINYKLPPSSRFVHDNMQGSILIVHQIGLHQPFSCCPLARPPLTFCYNPC